MHCYNQPRYIIVNIRYRPPPASLMEFCRSSVCVQVLSRTSIRYDLVSASTSRSPPLAMSVFSFSLPLPYPLTHSLYHSHTLSLTLSAGIRLYTSHSYACCTRDISRPASFNISELSYGMPQAYIMPPVIVYSYTRSRQLELTGIIKKFGLSE